MRDKWLARNKISFLMTESSQKPLEELMSKWMLSNQDLVAVSTEQLTYKQVKKAKEGLKLSLKMRMKIARALNVAIWNRLDANQKKQYFEYLHKHLFVYAKGFDFEWKDPNESLMLVR